MCSSDEFGVSAEKSVIKGLALVLIIYDVRRAFEKTLHLTNYTALHPRFDLCPEGFHAYSGSQHLAPSSRIGHERRQRLSLLSRHLLPFAQKLLEKCIQIMHSNNVLDEFYSDIVRLYY